MSEAVSKTIPIGTVKDLPQIKNPLIAIEWGEFKKTIKPFSPEVEQEITLKLRSDGIVDIYDWGSAVEWCYRHKKFIQIAIGNQGDSAECPSVIIQGEVSSIGIIDDVKPDFILE